jgi:hypothetical protein
MKIFYTTLFFLISLQLFATAPTTPSHDLYFGAVDGGYFNIGWSSGNGARRIIICKAGSDVTFTPLNGVDYNENTVFGSGQQVAPGEFVIYDHFSSSFFVTGLTAATQYFFRIFEYNGTGAAIEYLTSAYLSANGFTSATPTSQTSAAVFSNITTNSVNINWANGNGLRRLIVLREAAPVNANPVNNQSYAVSSVFGSGAPIGTGNFTVYNSTGTGTNVTNLKPGTEYFFSFYEFNGSSQPQYLTPAYTTSVTTRSIPTIASTNVIVTKTDGKEISFTWTSGNGQRRVIIARQSNTVTSQPANGTDYNANAVFGSGQELNTGEFVVFDDNFHSATISGLNPATTYFFKIFEYDGTGNNTVYLTTSFASGNAATISRPSLQAATLSAGNITPVSLTLLFTSGNGRGRLIIGRKNAPVNVTPADFTAYPANYDFGNGNFLANNTTDAFAGVQDLEANTTYHFAIFEYNGFNQPLYLSPAAIFSVSTLAALPVKLTKWEAIPSGNKVKLQWTTSAELNASHFIIERGSDGIHFSLFTTVQAAGNSQGDINYTKEDAAPLAGKSFYRLKMVDIDGKSEYSPVRIVLLSEKTLVKIVGNPVQNTLEFVTSSNFTNGKNEWQIINVMGQYIKKGNISAGRTEINVSSLPAGSYWLKLKLDDQLQTIAFIKQ